MTPVKHASPVFMLWVLGWPSPRIWAGPVTCFLTCEWGGRDTTWLPRPSHKKTYPFCLSFLECLLVGHSVWGPGCCAVWHSHHMRRPCVGHSCTPAGSQPTVGISGQHGGGAYCASVHLRLRSETRSQVQTATVWHQVGTIWPSQFQPQNWEIIIKLPFN